MNHFFFLAAGFGKRMGSWTVGTPKPLLNIDGISFLDYSLFLANKWGAKKSWINVHYLGDKIIFHLKKFNGFPLEISYEEKEILGTAGGIKTALENVILDQPLVLFNPDTLLFPNNTFKLKSTLPKESKIHLYLNQLSPNDNYTKVKLEESGHISFGDGDLYYIGLALIHLDILKEIESHTYADLSPIFKELAKTNQITGEIFDGDTLDLGEKDLYESYLNKNVFGDQKKELLDFIAKSFN